MSGARFFLDTNVFVYALQAGAPGKAARAADLIRIAGASQLGAVSYQVVQEFFSVAFRKFTRTLTPGDARFWLEDVFAPLWAVDSSPQLVGAALELQRRHRLSWFDALIVAAAQAADCRILYSEDFQHGQQFDRLRVENPFR